jgi:hypothetical protein
VSGLPAGARGWIADHLAPEDAVVSVERDAARGVVARVRTASRDAWFKADISPSPPEAAVLDRLGRTAPRHVAPLVAADLARGWTLTEHVGAEGLDDADTDTWCSVARALAEVQRENGLTSAEWLAVGCRDLTGAALRTTIDAVITAGAPDLDADERERLDALAPRIDEACDDLDGDGIADALVHRDVVPCNVVIRDDGSPVLIDWSDTVVGHPFFALDRLLDHCWTDADRKAAVIDAYLGAFDGVTDAARRRASFDRVLWLRVFYEGVRWLDEIADLDSDDEHAVRLRADMVHGLRLVARHLT